VEEIGGGEIELTCVYKKREVDKEGIRRKKCDDPEDLEFKPKPQLALEMLHGLQDNDTFPFKYVVSDTIYRSSPAFIQVIENRPGMVYFVAIPSDTLCWLEKPITREKKYKYKGEMRTKLIVEKTEKKPISVQAQEQPSVRSDVGSI
jgi:SRSO17 transposase